MISLTRVTPKNAKKLIGRQSPLNRLMAQAAYDLGYRLEIYENMNMFRVWHKGKSHLFRNIATPLNTYVGAQIADNKYVTNSILHDAGIPVPLSLRISKKAFEKGSFDASELRFPVVVKPLSGTVKGNGVITNIKTHKQMMKYLKSSFRKYSKMLVEEFHSGMNDYRVTVVNNKVVGVMLRVPAYVIGDGHSSIRDLMKEKNEIRKQSTDVKMGPIIVNVELKNALKHQKLSLRSTPKKGKHIQLQNVCNFGAGGEVNEMNNKIHKDNAAIAIKAAKALDLGLAGLDFLCKDISKPMKKTGGVILEINQHPDIGMHHFPTQGKSTDVARAILLAAFA